MRMALEQPNIAKQTADGITHYLLLLPANSYGRSFLPTPSWIGPLFLLDRCVRPIAAVTRAAPITIPKITSIVIVFPFPLAPCVGCHFLSSEPRSRCCSRRFQPRAKRATF
jgi:hypothetical protein